MISKDNSDKISIIVPLNKSEQFMRKCVDSILNQSHTNLELILVDDGSPDNSGTIAVYSILGFIFQIRAVTEIYERVKK